MNHPWPALVERLEAIELDVHFLDPEALAAAMADRQSILAELQSADASLLEPQLRSELKARLAAVQERDHAVLQQLLVLRDRTQEELAKAGKSRRAMDGYKSLVSSEPPPFRRIG
jgi:Flagellar protein FliT